VRINENPAADLPPRRRGFRPPQNPPPQNAKTTTIGLELQEPEDIVRIKELNWVLPHSGYQQQKEPNWVVPNEPNAGRTERSQRRRNLFIRNRFRAAERIHRHPGGPPKPPVPALQRPPRNPIYALPGFVIIELDGSAPPREPAALPLFVPQVLSLRLSALLMFASGNLRFAVLYPTEVQPRS